MNRLNKYPPTHKCQPCFTAGGKLVDKANLSSCDSITQIKLLIRRARKYISNQSNKMDILAIHGYLFKKYNYSIEQVTQAVRILNAQSCKTIYKIDMFKNDIDLDYEAVSSSRPSLN